MVEVTFKHRRRRVFRNDRKLDLMAGDDIIVGVRGGIDYGRVTMTGELAALKAKPQPNYNCIIRIANSRDRLNHENNRKSEAEVLEIFKAAAKKRRLPLKPVDVEWQHDRKRISLYYTAKEKLKLRGLISEFSRRFKARVDLRRIRAREEASRIGGIGACGRELCCSSWMNVIPSVDIAAAKKQHFTLSSDRLRGRCNRLKCCLNYELDQYLVALKEFPGVGTDVDTGAGTGTVDQVNIFQRTLTVRYSGGRTQVVPLDAIGRHERGARRR